MKILLVTGGSGGHLYPLVAVYRALTRLAPDAELTFVHGDRTEERDWLAHERIPAKTLPSVGRGWRMPFSLQRNARAAGHLLRAVQPDAVFTKGGSLGISLCRQAHAHGIPVVLHESDAVMGRANRIVAKRAHAVCCLGFDPAGSDKRLAVSTETHSSSHPSTRYPLTAHRSVIVTGNPVRPEITHGSREDGLRVTGFSGAKPILLVTGGSQGALSINTTVAAHLDALLRTVDIVHLTGQGKAGAAPRPGYLPITYAREELPHLYAIANLALTRGGAGSLAELAANGIPAIIVPLEGVAQDHQTANARAAEADGGCVLLRQTDMDARLPDLITAIAADPARRQAMSAAQRAAAPADAAEKIARVILEQARKRIADTAA
jgi:UDP-N-acetylglucosamine--N-acetylmuramyl-(pentapeptide) pyrophosphoryl-undecaprenol N-acetylglucosamine transferase